ncbi:MAG: hypothetical protein MJE68_09920 [Proteobacteria bacterium]|nr:hypothetical protein [Pseudomonadota bacterium]
MGSGTFSRHHSCRIAIRRTPPLHKEGTPSCDVYLGKVVGEKKRGKMSFVESFRLL